MLTLFSPTDTQLKDLPSSANYKSQVSNGCSATGRTVFDLFSILVLLQLRVLGFGLLIDGDVGIGVFPKAEEILIRRAGFFAGGRVFGGSPQSQRDNRRRLAQWRVAPHRSL